jgi:hypothetical protein
LSSGHGVAEHVNEPLNPKQCDCHRHVAAMDIGSGNFLARAVRRPSRTADCGQQSTASICRTETERLRDRQTRQTRQLHTRRAASGGGGGDEMPLQHGTVPSGPPRRDGLEPLASFNSWLSLGETGIYSRSRKAGHCGAAPFINPRGLIQTCRDCQSGTARTDGRTGPGSN